MARGRIPHLTWGRAVLGGVVAFSLLFGLAGAYVLMRNRGPAEARAGERTMLAVLPFENLGASEDEYFADGVTKEITTRLAGISRLGIISRTSTLQYRNTTKPIKQIGKELGVEYVLEGSVRWQPASSAGRPVRITPQLIRVSDDSHVWADAFEEDSGEIFRIQSEIAEKVVNALDITLRGRERRSLKTQPTKNLDAYDFYLRGKDYANRSAGAEDERIAAEMYQKAVELDPGFALAWAELSKANTRLYFILADPSGARLSAAKEAVETAVRLAPELPEAHLAFGYYYYHGSRDYDRALWEFAIAREGQPSNAELEEASAFVQRRQGRFNEALAILKRAAELDPRSAPGRWRWDSCFSSCDATRRPSDTAIARARSPPKSPTPTGGSFCSTWIRAPTRSRRRRPLPLSKDALSYTPWWLAIVLARAGDDQAALDELETLLSVPYYFSASFLTMDPRMDPLRDNPRFQKLIGEAAR